MCCVACNGCIDYCSRRPIGSYPPTTTVNVGRIIGDLVTINCTVADDCVSSVYIDTPTNKGSSIAVESTIGNGNSTSPRSNATSRGCGCVITNNTICNG